MNTMCRMNSVRLMGLSAICIIAAMACAPAEEAPGEGRTSNDAVEVVASAQALRLALLDAEPGDVVAIAAGRFDFDRSLSLSVDGVTVRARKVYSLRQMASRSRVLPSRTRAVTRSRSTNALIS